MQPVLRLISLAAACLGASMVAHADTMTFECDYSTYSDRAGIHKVERPFRLTFLIDSRAEKAYLIGNNGSAEVLLIPNGGGLTLVETTGTGNVMVTAIATKGDSVHSRNGIMNGTIIPSQYYGKCIAK